MNRSVAGMFTSWLMMFDLRALNHRVCRSAYQGKLVLPQPIDPTQLTSPAWPESPGTAVDNPKWAPAPANMPTRRQYPVNSWDAHRGEAFSHSHRAKKSHAMPRGCSVGILKFKPRLSCDRAANFGAVKQDFIQGWLFPHTLRAERNGTLYSGIWALAP